jgi:SAM-dependent methyltransferase
MECRICKNKNKNSTYTVKEMLYGSQEEFDYIECDNCKCLQLKIIPDNLGKYYPSDYYSYNRINRPKGIRRILTNLRNKYAVFDKGIIGKYLHSRRPTDGLRALSNLPLLTKKSRVIDVGCGSGALLSALEDLGFDSLLGLDPFNENDLRHSRYLTIRKGGIADADGEWDLVMFHHSFEHIPNPQDTLKSVYNLLIDGGYCLIRIPTVSSYAWTHYKTNWVQLDAPRHLFLHSIESMKILSRKVGFSITDIVYDSTIFQFVGSEQYAKNIPLNSKNAYGKNPKNSMFTSEEINEFDKRTRELNLTKQGDQAIFILKK